MDYYHLYLPTLTLALPLLIYELKKFRRTLLNPMKPPFFIDPVGQGFFFFQKLYLFLILLFPTKEREAIIIILI